MTPPMIRILSLGAGALFVLSACGTFGGNNGNNVGAREPQAEERGSTIWDAILGANAPDEVGSVNKYIWNASLEILNFLPIQSVDPSPA